MPALSSLVESLRNTPGLPHISLSSLSHFIRLISALKHAILLRQPPNWNPTVAPASLLPRLRSFIAARLAVEELVVDGLWAALRDEVWSVGTSMVGDDVLPPRVLDDLTQRARLSEHMLFPPTTVCNSADCVGFDKLLRWKDDPKEVVMFTMSQGVHDGYEVHLHCHKCQTVYYPNYTVRDDTRRYYAGIPQYIQVSEHHYAEEKLLEHFTTLSVLSWTSATNAAHIYHHSMSQLDDDRRNVPRYQLRTESTWDGFVILALLRDARFHSLVLEVPHCGMQKDRFTDTMRMRNERIRRAGQPEYSHWCTKCYRRFDNPDGTVAFVDCLITDGIVIGRPCCSARHCTGELRTPQDHWCASHQDQAAYCAIDGCREHHREGFRTCALHAPVEEHYGETGQSFFTLRTRLQRAHMAHPTDAVDLNAAADEDIEVEVTPARCDDKPEGGFQNARGRFGRRHTHNEQILVRPCGIIRARETFYGSETVPQVVDMLHKKHLVPGSMPCYVCYDNNCSLYKHCQSKEAKGEPERLHHDVGLPVDVFHWKTKHKKSDIECSFHCNPHMFPELIGTDGKTYYFNTSRAEQTNVWLGGFHAIVREMGGVKYDFFLDEMILRKNDLTRSKLEADGYLPSYIDHLRFATTDVSA